MVIWNTKQIRISRFGTNWIPQDAKLQCESCLVFLGIIIKLYSRCPNQFPNKAYNEQRILEMLGYFADNLVF